MWLAVLLAASLGLQTAPGRAAEWNPARDIASDIFLGAQPLWHQRSELVPGNILSVALPKQQRAYRVAEGYWWWRRAPNPTPSPQDIETLHFDKHRKFYVLSTDDIDQFLSACVPLRIAPDIVSSYCTDFIGPIRAVPPSALCPHPVRDAVAGQGSAPALPGWMQGRLRLEPFGDGAPPVDPVDLLPWPDGGWVVAERAGKALLHRPGQAPCLLLDLTPEVGILGPENGLLSLALSPRFAAAPFLYAYYTTWMPTRYGQISRLSRFSVQDGRIRRETELALLETVPVVSGSHFGGGLRFGPDGLLYLSVGDRGLSEAAQTLDSPFGKILRLDVRQATRAQPYRIPPDNPLRGRADAWPEIYAWGFRNPWRLAFDAQDGTLWVGDVGAYHREEVNQVRAGANYGWPLWEGDLCARGVAPAACAALDSVRPLASYAHAPGLCAVIGGRVYRGAALPWLAGSYLFGDHCSGQVWALTPQAPDGWQQRPLLRLAQGHLQAFAVDARGEILLLLKEGPILRVTAAPPDLRAQ